MARCSACDAWAKQNEHLARMLTTAERERDEARRERDLLRTAMVWAMGDYPSDAVDAATEYVKKAEALRDHAVRTEAVVEAARAWLADLWRGDLNGTVIGVCMEYEPDGQYALWEQVAPIAEAVRALDAAEGTC